jgi:uncharacterized damage-inducible protein DinB
MTSCALTFRELLEYTRVETEHWHRWLAALFAAFADTRTRLDAWLNLASDADLAQRMEFQTLSAGGLSASARKVVVHLLLHGVRHWAQLATSLRQQGYATDWHHDILMSDAFA